VPLLTQLAVRSKEDRIRFNAELTGLAVAVGSILLVIMAVLIPFIVQHPSLGFSSATVLKSRGFAVTLSPLLLLGILSGLASARLLALERHGNTLLQGIPPFVLVVALLISPSDSSLI